MAEKEKKLATNKTTPDDPFIDSDISTSDKNVFITSGVHYAALPVAGKTVADIRKLFAERLHIETVFTPVVNGEDKNEDYVVQAGEMLTFVHPAGERG